MPHSFPTRPSSDLPPFLPQLPCLDPGDVLEDVGLDPETVEGGLEPGIDLVRAQPARSVDVGETGNGDVLEQHGRTPKGLREQASLAPQALTPGRVPVGAVTRVQPPQRQTA